MPLKPISLFRRASTELLEAAVCIERESQKEVPDLHRIDTWITSAIKALSKVHLFTHQTN